MTAGIPGQNTEVAKRQIPCVCYVVSALGCAFAWTGTCCWPARFIVGSELRDRRLLGPVVYRRACASEIARAASEFSDQHRPEFCWLIFRDYIYCSFGLGDADLATGLVRDPRVYFLILCCLEFRPVRAGWMTQKRVEEARSVLQIDGAEDAEGELRR